MSVLGAISQKDKGTGVLPNLQAPPESTGFFQNIHAGFTQAVAGPHSTQNARAIYESRNYDQIIQALNAEGEKATDYIDSPVDSTSPFYRHVDGEQILPDGRVKIPVKRGFTNPFSEGPSLTRDVNPIANLYLGGDSTEIKNIWDAVGRVRARKPGFLKDLPDANALDAIALKQRQADELTAGNVTSRATTLGKVGSFIGSVGGSISSLDPENFVGGFSGAAGKSFSRNVVKRAVSGAVANTAAGTVALPGQVADSERLGQPMTVGDMAKSVAENAAAGALLGTVHATVSAAPHAVGTVAGKAFDKVAPHIPDAIRDPIVAASIRAGTVKDRALLYEFQRQHNPWTVSDTSTPTEKAAAHVITTDVETQEQSPLHPGAAGANNDRLGAVAKALGVDLTPPDMPTTAPTQTATVRDRAGQSPSSPAVKSYVDAYLRGEGRGTTQADREMEQFAANNAADIEKEFQFRARQSAAPAPRRPASLAEATVGAEGKPERNPASTADGYGQFTEPTWRHMIHTYAPELAAGKTDAEVLALRHDKTLATRMTSLYGQENGRYLRAHGLEDSPGNLSLAHFLGASDAAKVLKADPTAPIESVIDPRSFAANRKLLTGKSADQVIAWAHKRIGAAVDHPPARPDAVPDEGYDYSSPAPYTVETLRPEAITTDAATMQYKSGGDEQGVTGILADQTAYNRLISHDLLIYRREDGTNVLVDGHQRLGLARRINDPSLKLPSLVIHEADGITPEQARTLGALRNIANGTGSLIDNAKVLRDAPSAASLLPRNVPLARDSMGLAHLSYEAFGAAVNEVVPPEIAAQVGLNAPHNPEAHLPILSLLAKEKITDPKEAAAITRQALADGFGTAHSEQLSMLGAEPQQSLYKPIARIMAAAAKKLRDEKRTFKVLTEKSSKIESVGNVLDKTANASKVIGNDEALAILDRTAHSAGPVRDALIAAARAELSGARRGDAVNQFLDQLGGIDLRAAAAGVGSHGLAGEPLGRAGRDLAAEASDENIPRGSEPSLFEIAVAARDGAEKFSDPVSPEAKQQADLIEHDLRMDAKVGAGVKADVASEDFRKWYAGSKLVDGEGKPVPLYHGGSEPIDAIDMGRGAQGVFWATTSKDSITGGTSGATDTAHITELYAKLENPAGWDEYDKYSIDELEAQGYDGVILPEDGKSDVIIFHPEQARIVGGAAETPHLFDLPETGFRLSEEGNAVSIKEALDSADADEAAAKALRDCL